MVLCAGLALGGCANRPGVPVSAPPAPVAAEAAAPAPKPGCKALGPSKQQATAVGAVVGGLLGAAIGSESSRRSSVGARNGLLLGALAGGLVGSQMGSSVKLIELDDGSVRLDIPGSVLFSSGSANISDGFKPTLDTVSKTIREYCGLTAQVVGHTDSVGRPQDNKNLSVNRARSVVSYLTSTGITPDRLSADGMGLDRPVADNSSEFGRQQNRRVEIFVRPPAN